MGKITIGTDPELIFADEEGKLLKASNFVKSRDGAFGVDGHPYIAELRPNHAVFPRDLVENIRTTLEIEAIRLKDLTWLAGPYVLEKPMGGHLHYGVPYEDKLVEALDMQLGFLLALSEPEEGARWRRTNIFPGSHDPKPYGTLGNYRKKDWGFEYRTPSSFIVSPGVALATITVGKAIIYEEMERGGMAWSLLPKHVRKDLSFSKDDFYNCNKALYYGKLESYWNVLKSMKYFQKGMEGHSLWSAVAYFKSRVFPKQGFIQGKDLKVKWGLDKVASKTPTAKKKKPHPIIVVGNGEFWGDMKLIKKTEHKEKVDKPILNAEEAWDLIKGDLGA